MKSDQQIKGGQLVLLKFFIITGMLMISVSLGWAGNNACTATSDLQTEILHIPCLEYDGDEYWADFHLTTWTPVTVELQNYGIKDNTCQDDDVVNGIYRFCNYFPIDTGNMKSFNNYSATVSGATHTFTGGTGKRINNASGLCVPYDLFVSSNGNSVKILGQYDREENVYIEYPDNFIWAPQELRIGDSWVNSLGSITLTSTFVSLETVTVPAGTFEDCLKIKLDIEDSGSKSTTYYWYAKDVGAVKIERTYENPIGWPGCSGVTSEYPLAELQSAWINGVSYPLQ